MTNPSLIHELLRNPLSGPEIEARSFAIIDQENTGHSGFSPTEWEIVRRMIHTCADPRLADNIRFSHDAIASGVEALRGGTAIYADSNMIRAGLSLARLRAANASYGPDKLVCHVADADVAKEAEARHLPRSLYAIRKAKALLAGGIAVFGNAPVALLELNRMVLEENLRPALVIAMPVGFVHVVESKLELMSLGVPFIAIEGRRGGSTLAVSVVHALCTIAARSSLGAVRNEKAVQS
ncbi:MAG: precorrin-8X methylmutase [Candidatus Korobacteraceae bacterium]